MPELPEVETTVKYLRSLFGDQKVENFTVTNGGERQLNLPPNKLSNRLIGRKLSELSRVGKWMLFTFQNSDGPVFIVGHLRMSGRYKAADEVIPHPHNRFQFHLGDGQVVNYVDQRRFGTFHEVESFGEHPALKALGPDIFSKEFTSEYLSVALQKKSKPIYSALLDQTVVAGLGNIYVNEVLHAAKIHPLQPANTLTSLNVEKIVKETLRILTLALKYKGTTLIDNLYQDPDGKKGQFYKLLKVYGKKTDPEIEVLKIGGRSVFVHKDTKLHQ